MLIINLHCLAYMLFSVSAITQTFLIYFSIFILIIYFIQIIFRIITYIYCKFWIFYKKVKAKCYSEHNYSFYVYAKPNKCDPQNMIKYTGRYLGRPDIATSRIDKYDGEMVTFHYNRHEDEQYVEKTIPAMEFIQRLIHTYQKSTLK